MRRQNVWSVINGKVVVVGCSEQGGGSSSVGLRFSHRLKTVVKKKKEKNGFSKRPVSKPHSTYIHTLYNDNDGYVYCFAFGFNMVGPIKLFIKMYA